MKTIDAKGIVRLSSSWSCKPFIFGRLMSTKMQSKSTAFAALQKFFRRGVRFDLNTGSGNLKDERLAHPLVIFNCRDLDILARHAGLDCFNILGPDNSSCEKCFRCRRYPRNRASAMRLSLRRHASDLTPTYEATQQR